MPLTDVTQHAAAEACPPCPDSHKGAYGHALVVGGSRGMSGAISLTGLATLRSGAGLVTLVVPRTIQDVVAGFNPSYMTHGLADASEHMVEAAADEVLALAENMTAVALGPGLGRTPGVTDFVARLYREIKQPMVVDADALVALAAAQGTARPSRRPAHPHAPPRRIRPTHRHQARHATTTPAPSPQASSLQRVGAPAHLIVVLKGHHTVITDGTRYALNQTGNPGMATGGTGDVLTGIITALLCQGLAPFDAARLGVHVHGLAGDLAAEKLGQVSLIASDLIDYLPAAFQAIA